MLRLSLSLAAIAACSAALCTDWIEGSGGSGDAGSTIATSQDTIGPAGLTSIKGVAVTSDGDIYRITISNPAAFSASTASSSSAADTQLFLFNPSGTGVAFNDDLVDFTDFRSTLSGPIVTSIAPGTYYLGVSNWDSDAEDVAALELWAETPSTGTRAPDGAAAANPMVTMAQPLSSLGVIYTITLTGCDPGTIGATQPPPSTAGTWTETTDAGDLVASAQVTTGSGPLTKIRGDLPSSTDVDMYRIVITNPAAFTATTVGNGTTMGDGQLYLFKPDGTGVAYNDDDPAFFSYQPAFDSSVSSLVPGAGVYYIAIARWNSPAQSGANDMWLAEPYTTVRGPDGPGAAGALTGWSYSTAGTAGDYIIDLTGAEFAASAEVTVTPTTLTPGPGAILAGGIAEASSSDDARVNMRPGAILVATADPLVLTASATAPGATASSLKVQIESRATVGGIRQIVEARNFTLSTWTELENFTGLPFGANPDRAVTFVVPNPTDHIGPGNEIRVRIRCKNTTAVLVYPWQTQFDEVTWRFTP